MIQLRLKSVCAILAGVALLAGCAKNENVKVDDSTQGVTTGKKSRGPSEKGTRLLDAFRGGKGDVKVNRFLWTATLDVLDFLPVQAADPFTGVISTGYGNPPGGGAAYRATILISDPALDARSLNVALQSKRGPVSTETQRAVEDAILTRARQLRIQAGTF